MPFPWPLLIPPTLAAALAYAIAANAPREVTWPLAAFIFVLLICVIVWRWTQTFLTITCASLSMTCASGAAFGLTIRYLKRTSGDSTENPNPIVDFFVSTASTPVSISLLLAAIVFMLIAVWLREKDLQRQNQTPPTPPPPPPPPPWNWWDYLWPPNYFSK